MTWQAKATLAQLVTFIDGLTGVQSVTKGEPTSYTAAVSASISLGAAPMNDRQTTGNVRRDLEYWVTFGYRTSNNVALAEETLADILDELESKFLVERKTGRLGGTVDSMELDTSPASAAEYRPVAGQEYRLYPVIIRVVQQHTVS